MSDSESDEDLDWAQLLDSKVLKRGEKDHAPDGTEFQQSALSRSREAMYAILRRPVKTAAKQMIECDWDAERQVGRVRKAKGKFFASMGWAVREVAYLHPEEVCYLCERGSMICYYEGRALSIEGVLSLMLHLVGAEKLAVYSHLKKLGYVVRRDAAASATNELHISQPGLLDKLTLSNAAWWLAGSHFDQLAWRPVYLRYSSVYSDLQCVRQRGEKTYEQSPGYDYLVWKPSTKFKKSVADNADYFVKIVSADAPVPVLDDFEVELAKQTPHVSEKKSVITRMREGIRSVLYAVVDNGVVSFIRVGEPALESAV